MSPRESLESLDPNAQSARDISPLISDRAAHRPRGESGLYLESLLMSRQDT